MGTDGRGARPRLRTAARRRFRLRCCPRRARDRTRVHSHTYACYRLQGQAKTEQNQNIE